MLSLFLHTSGADQESFDAAQQEDVKEESGNGIEQGPVSGESFEGDEASENSVAELKSLMVALKQYRRLKRAVAVLCALMLSGWIIIILMVRKIPAFIFGKPDAPIRFFEQGITELIMEPSLFTLLLTFGFFLLSVAVLALAIGVSHGMSSLGMAKPVFNRIAELLAVCAIVFSLAMIGEGWGVGAERIQKGTLPALPTDSMILGTPYKTVWSWRHESASGRQQGKIIAPIARQVDVESSSRGMEYYLYARVDSDRLSAVEPLLSGYAKSALASLSDYGLPQAKVSVHIDDWDRHTLLERTYQN
ncbi:hypothetical protein KIMH_04700 [Bombiscardovia apis]|uniref:Uncharacterized protein n=1 Tax=Bombiscardovia apis TaxID=2932182 RepID=A0ABN6SEA7_9BIFI|nr:hypothetical protein [Bombiscardovia apis]BDR54359.1 hypothetical protein KIMH_04700 [Bombiscardovia apis]